MTYKAMDKQYMSKKHLIPLNYRHGL